jgi:hypothetical protein
LRFLPLQRSENGERPTPGLPHPAVLRSQVFSTSQRFNSPRIRHGLVSCRWHSWGFPFRVFPLLKCVVPLDTRSPLDVSKQFQKRSTRQAVLHAPFPIRPPPGGYPSSKSVLAAPDVNPNTAADTLLGFIPSKGLPRFAMEPPSRPLLSRTSTPAHLPCKQVRLPFARYPRVSFDKSCGLSFPHSEKHVQDCRPS